MLFGQSKTKGCDECDTKTGGDPEFAEAEKEFIKATCAACPHDKKVRNPELMKLLHYMRLEDGKCPVGRHELTDFEWINKGIVESEWNKLVMEWHKTHKTEDE